MNTADWIGIGIAVAILLLMLLGWLGVYPKSLDKVLSKRTSTSINWMVVLLAGCVGTIIYLAIAEKEIPFTLYMIALLLLLSNFGSRTKPSK